MRLRTALLGASMAVAAMTGLDATGSAAPPHATPIPTHVFAPYFEMWNGQSPSATAKQSGAKYLTLAFLQTNAVGSCTIYWNGNTSTPVSSSSYGSEIAALKANGGGAIPSLGGYTADHTGTEIADSCTDVSKIAAAYESLITTYGLTRIDLDTEDNSLTDNAGIDRRNKAIKMTEDWAAANGRTVQFCYTLPTTTSGLASSGLAVLRNAVSDNARVDVVNVMTFDYYDNANHGNMAIDTENSVNGLVGQLRQLHPGKSFSQLWAMVGITEMPGIDDFGPAETFTVPAATQVYDWAVAKGISELSFWALQRDNGGCPGTGGSDSCSGISQNTWDFSHVFEPFTARTSHIHPR